MLPALSPNQTGVERRQQIGEPRLAHPVGEVERVAAVDEEDVGLLAPTASTCSAGRLGSAVSSSSPTRLPAELDHRSARIASGDEAPGARAGRPPGCAYEAVGMHERVALGDRLAEELDEGARGCSGS